MTLNRPDLRSVFDGSVGRTVHGLSTAPSPETPPTASPAQAGIDSAQQVPWTAEEAALLASVETYLERGKELKAWWQTVFPDGFQDRFRLSRSFDRPDSSFGFFDHAPVAGRQMPVMGNFQRMFWDEPKTYTGCPPRQQGTELQRQMQEFVLHYFMRVSDFREPEVVASSGGGNPPPWLRPFSLCRPNREQQIGFGFSQLYYKTREGDIGRFDPSRRFAIIDLRQLMDRYQWIVVKVRIFDFSFSYTPFGESGPRLTLPLAEESYLVLTRDFINNQPPEEGNEIGRYGIGYAFIRSPGSSILGYGPGEFEAAIELIDFFVDEDGRVRVAMVFVSNRPQRIVNLSLDPADWAARMGELVARGRSPAWLAPLQSFARHSPMRRFVVDPIYGSIDAANLFTGGLAKQLLCASRRTLEEEFLIKHFEQHYQTVATALRTWRQVPDWLDTSVLPEQARLGI